ncbi:radical SAM/SPASM domain-containing protein [Geotoga petraea]|nr:radical SAM protein [Geotoga petraea]SDC70244.1 uncharacterized protein SAMN04488588_1629 [Geotoga petraea]
MKNINEIKKSKYNIEISLNGNWVIYNTLKNSMLELNEEFYSYYKNNKIVSEKITQKFYEYGLWLDKDYDEIKELKMLYLRKIYSSDYLNLTIKTTNNCNFNCVYCYQDHLKTNLENDVILKIKNFIDKKVENDNIKYIFIHWFGGEPLINPQPIFDIENYILKKYKNIDLKSSMTTNGYLLNKKNIEKLKNTQINSFQITIDGNSDEHNKTRKTNQGENTYDKILKNIKNILEKSNFEILIRINVNKNNSDINKFLIQMEKNKLLNNNRISFHFNEAKKMDISYTNKDIFYQSVKEYSKDLLLIYNLLLNKKIKIPFYFTKGYNCEFDRLNTYLINTDGKFYRCSSSEKEEAFYLGDINSKGELFKNAKSFYNKMLRDPFESKKCFDCKVMPWCMGGCGFLKVKKINECIPEKYIINDLIKLYYKESKNEKNFKF